MRHRIVHTTTHTYDGSVQASFNEARMTPLTTPEQTALDTRVEVSPAASISRYWDYWGTHVTAFDIHARHQAMVTTASSLVEVDRPAQPVHAVTTWERLHSAEARDLHVEHLTQTPRTVPPTDGFVEHVHELAAGVDPREAAHRVCAWVREEVKYVTGATGVHATAAESWEQRSGVCQDLAHLALAGLRELGIPARYVSGYLHPKREPQLNVEVAGESHAWIDFFDGEWTGWDPTNGVPIGNRHVVVARARDYSDVSPLRGVYSGPTSTVKAMVAVTRVA